MRDMVMQNYVLRILRPIHFAVSLEELYGRIQVLNYAMLMVFIDHKIQTYATYWSHMGDFCKDHCYCLIDSLKVIRT